MLRSPMLAGPPGRRNAMNRAQLLSLKRGSAHRLHWSLALTLAAAGGLAFAGGCSKSTGQSADTNVGVQSILFIKRVHTTVDDQGAVSIDVAGGNGQVLDYERYVPGGSLNILSPPRPDGDLKNITADYTTADFNGA